MKPLFIRSLSAEERHHLKTGLRSRDAFTLRRCQVLLASAEGTNPTEIAKHLGCATQTVRNAIPCFEAEGLSSLQAKLPDPRSCAPSWTERSLKRYAHCCTKAHAPWENHKALGHWGWLLKSAMSVGCVKDQSALRPCAKH